MRELLRTLPSTYFLLQTPGRSLTRLRERIFYWSFSLNKNWVNNGKEEEEWDRRIKYLSSQTSFAKWKWSEQNIWNYNDEKYSNKKLWSVNDFKYGFGLHEISAYRFNIVFSRRSLSCNLQLLSSTRCHFTLYCPSLCYFFSVFQTNHELLSLHFAITFYEKKI